MGSSRIRALGRRKRKRLPAKAKQVSLTALRAVGRPAASKRRRPAIGSPWKLVGLAGIAGVAATGVVVARNRRAHRELPPDELRERLHERLAEVGAESGAAPAPPAAPADAPG
jgi:hypothetical protein